MNKSRKSTVTNVRLNIVPSLRNMGLIIDAELRFSEYVTLLIKKSIFGSEKPIYE